MRDSGRFVSGSQHPNWKGGKLHDNCVECNIKLAGHDSTRCKGCEAKRRIGTKKPNAKGFPRCQDCGALLKDYRSKRCRVCANSGPLSRNWKGGVTEQRNRIRASVEYRAWRKLVFERDDYTCQICFARGVQIQADHLKPFALYPELRFELSNGRTLCVPCHRTTDTWGGKVLKMKRED